MVAARVWVDSYYSGGNFCVCLRAELAGRVARQVDWRFKDARDIIAAGQK